jgi:hypothetical protein
MKLGLSDRRQHRGEAPMESMSGVPDGYVAGLSSTVYPSDSIFCLSLAARVSGSSSPSLSGSCETPDLLHVLSRARREDSR